MAEERVLTYRTAKSRPKPSCGQKKLPFNTPHVTLWPRCGYECWHPVIGGDAVSGSVSSWLVAFRDGDREAAELLWKRYYAQLIRIARSRLRGLRNPLSTAEDVALAAFEAFCRGFESGRYPHVCDRNNLWHLLLYITTCQSRMVARYESRQRRLSSCRVTTTNFALQLDAIADREPTPVLALETAEALGGLLGELDDGQLRDLAILRMEGYTTAEIAANLQCSVSTVERKLRRIRQIWSHHVGL
jgi:RNA polymerase sigma factor (sigma-70 family)